MFGTASEWIGIYNIWYYGVLMALNGNEAISLFIIFVIHPLTEDCLRQLE